MRVGLIVNPIAGIGGPAAAKGSDIDGARLLAAGAAPTAPARAAALVAATPRVEWVSPAGCIGVPGTTRLPGAGAILGASSAADTRVAVTALAEAGIDLLCFVGGDGTATDVAAVAGDLPCLGVPGGVKITSPVFAHDVAEAAWLVAGLTPGFETTTRDVTDLDEAAYRDGRLDTRLTGALRVPLSPVVQGGKAATSVETPLDGLVEQVLRDWDRDAVWLVGAGSVCRAVKQQFWGEPTLLGVDVIDGDRIVATDLNATAVRRIVADAHADGRTVRLLLSIIGGQGMLLGRGTQVLPSDALAAIGWEHVTVAAPPEKLLGLRQVHVDSGDAGFDAAAPDYLRVTSGYGETRMVKIARPPAGP